MHRAIAVLFLSLTAAAQTTTKVDWTQLKNVPAVVRMRSGSGAPTGLTCTAPTDAYLDIVSHHLYFCVSANVWADVSGTGGGGLVLSALTNTQLLTLTNSQLLTLGN